MASRRKMKSEGIIRRFVVNETKMHEKGYTVYKVVQQIIPVDKTDGQIIELVIWHRYSEFKKLYQATKQLHTMLHRKEVFPSFAEAKVFGRFEKAVIEDRIKSANELLNFIGQRVYLVKSKTFEDFFSGASVTDVSERAEVLQPDLVSLNVDTNILDEHIPLDVDDMSDAVPGNESVWNWLKTDEEEMSICSEDREIVTESVGDSSSGQVGKMSAFDPFSAAETGGRIPRDNFALLSEMCVEPVPAAVDFVDNVDAAVCSNNEGSSISSSPAIQRIADEASLEMEPSDTHNEDFSLPTVTLSTADTVLLPVPVAATTAQYLKELDPVSSPKHSPGQVKRVSRVERSDYIYQAATQFSLAQQCEANENYHMAFNYYKSGVGILLTGVQKDESEERREVVRRKTAKYLLKAEQLYANYLNTATSHDKMYNWDTGKPSPAKELEPEAAFIQGPPSELKRYSVLGLVADRHMLVVDNVTGSTWLLKVLLKSSVTRSPLCPNIIPTSCAFMVKLQRFYELDSAIYLLLEYVSGGTLWSLVSSYLRTDESPWQPEVKQKDAHVQSDNAVKESGVNKTEPVVTVGSAGVAFTRDINTSSSGHEQGTVVSVVDNITSQHDGSSKATQKRVSFDDNPVSSQLTVNCHDRMDQSLTDPQSPDSFSRESSSEPDRLSMLSPQVHDLRDGPDFCHVLGQVHRSLDNFSICSYDSGDGVPVLVSKCESVVSTIDTIDEDVEQSGSVAFKQPAVGDGSNVVNHCGDKCEGNCTVSNADNDQGSVQYLAGRKEARSISCDSCSSDVFSDNRTMPPADSSITAKTAENFATTAFFIDSSESTATVKNVAVDITMCATSQHAVNNIAVAPASEDADRKANVQFSAENEDHVSLKSCRSEVNLPTADEHAIVSGVRPRQHRLSSAFDQLDLAGGNQRMASSLPEDCVRRWAAELVCAVSHLHTLGLLILDLRPANVLLTDRGHIRLTYISQWSAVIPRLSAEARDNLYMAPEVFDANEPTEAADWWSVGALLYELLTGKSLAYNHPAGLTAHRNLCLPAQLSAEAKSLLTQLLAFNPSERLGAGSMGADDVKAHPFFVGIDWRVVHS